MCLLKAELPAAIWPHTDSFSTPQVSKVKTQASVCLCVYVSCVWISKWKMFQEVILSCLRHIQESLQLHLRSLSLFFRFLSDRSDSSGWFAWVLRETAPPFVCMYAWVCVRVNTTPVKVSVSLVFCWCLTALCRGAGLELKSFSPHVAWALHRLEHTKLKLLRFL